MDTKVSKSFDVIERNKWYWVKKKYFNFRDDRTKGKIKDEQRVLVFLPELEPKFNRDSFYNILSKSRLKIAVYQRKENIEDGRKKVKTSEKQTRGPHRELLEHNEKIHSSNPSLDKSFKEEGILYVNAYFCETVSIDAFLDDAESISEENIELDKSLLFFNRQLYPHNETIGVKYLRKDIEKGKPGVGDEDRYYFDQPDNGGRRFNEGL